MNGKFFSIVKKNRPIIGWQLFLRSSFFLFSFFLPLNTRLSNAFLIVSMVLAVIFLHQNPNARNLGVQKKMLIYSVLPFFLLHIMGLLYTSYLEDGYRYLEKTISFLLVPIIFLFFRREQLLQILSVLLKGLLCGSVISVLVLVGLNLSNYFLNRETYYISKDLFDYYHTYQYYTKPLNQHPTYLGLYYLTGLIFMNEILHRIWIKITLVIVFLIGFLFLNSRIIFLVILLSIILFVLIWGYRLLKIKKYKLLLMYILGLGIFLFTTLKFISGTYIGYRIKNIYKFEISTENEEKFNSKAKSNPRMSRWISSLKLVEERPLFGYGIADEYPNLKIQFEKDKMYVASKMGYNAHNQFIGYAIRFGMVGVFLLCFFFLINAKLALTIKNYRYFVLILIVFCVSMVENFFDRNYGITFSAVFFTLFSYIGFQTLKSNIENQKLNS